MTVCQEAFVQNNESLKLRLYSELMCIMEEHEFEEKTIEHNTHMA